MSSADTHTVHQREQCLSKTLLVRLTKSLAEDSASAMHSRPPGTPTLSGRPPGPPPPAQELSGPPRNSKRELGPAWWCYNSRAFRQLPTGTLKCIPSSRHISRAFRQLPAVCYKDAYGQSCTRLSAQTQKPERRPQIPQLPQTTHGPRMPPEATPPPHRPPDPSPRLKIRTKKGVFIYGSFFVREN